MVEERRELFQKILARYTGPHKNLLSLLWKKAEADGTLDDTIQGLLENNHEGLPVEEALDRWRVFSESDNEEYVSKFFSSIDEDETFNEGVGLEIENLSDEERDSISDINNLETGDKTLAGDTEHTKGVLSFPSMDPDLKEADRLTKGEKFRALGKENEKIEAEQRRTRRLFDLEQKIIREQGPVNRLNLDKNYMEDWLNQNPEYKAQVEAEWAREDEQRELQRDTRPTLWDK